MPAQTRVGDKNTGHDECPPISLAQGSPNVFVNGIPAGRVGDPYNPHSCPNHVPHAGVITQGSPTVFINGIPAGRIGDPVSCGGSVMEGSPNVFNDDLGNEWDWDNPDKSTAEEKTGQPISSDEKERREALAYDISKQIIEARVEQKGDLIAEEGSVKKNNGAYKIITNLVEIAQTISDRCTDEKDKTGWLMFKEQMKRWLSSDTKEKADISEDPFIVDLNWALQWEHSRKTYKNLLEGVLYNGETRKFAGARELVRSLQKAGQWPNESTPIIEFDHINYDPDTVINSSSAENDKPANQWDYWDKLYFNARNANRYYELDNSHLNFLEHDIELDDNLHVGFGGNGLLAGLGSFALRSLGAGEVKLIGNKKYEIKVKKMAVYIADSFDFTDNKTYGGWSLLSQDYYPEPYITRMVDNYVLDSHSIVIEYIKKKLLSMMPEDAVELTDQDFKNLSKISGFGHAFNVFSNPQMVDDWEEQTIVYDAVSETFSFK